MAEITDKFTFTDIEGREYAFYVGYNDEKRKVIFVLMRGTKEIEFRPVIEMDVDVLSFYNDAPSDFDPRPVK